MLTYTEYLTRCGKSIGVKRVFILKKAALPGNGMWLNDLSSYNIQINFQLNVILQN